VSASRAGFRLSHPLGLSSTRHWLRLLLSHGVDWRDAPRACAITLTAPLTSPLRAAERLIYARVIERTTIEPPPVFILGHWRTGTTHLHNMLAQDPNFSYLTTFQALAPEMAIAGERWLKPVLARFIPERRRMDNVAIGVDSPQEDELALSLCSLTSVYTGLYFPRRLRAQFDRYALFEGGDADRAAWRPAYLALIRKCAYMADGRRLSLKNPLNTARVAALLELFPDARFVFLRRNPYVVYPSTMHFFRESQADVGLQRMEESELRELVLYLFERMMGRYFEERGLIPDGHLVEVAFEDLEVRPLDEVERIYSTFQLPDWEAARERITAYLAELANYQKNQYAVSRADCEMVEARWALALDAWRYDRPV
jgi:hypothetical protein